MSHKQPPELADVRILKDHSRTIPKCNGTLYHNSTSFAGLHERHFSECTYRVKVTRTNVTCFIESRNITMMKRESGSKMENGHLLLIRFPQEKRLAIGVCIGLLPYINSILFLEWNGRITYRSSKFIPSFLVDKMDDNASDLEIIAHVNKHFHAKVVSIDLSCKFLNTIWDNDIFLYSCCESTINKLDLCVQSAFEGPDQIYIKRLCKRIQVNFFEDAMESNATVSMQSLTIKPANPRMKQSNEIFNWNCSGSLREWNARGPLKHPKRVKKHDEEEEVFHLNESMVIEEDTINENGHPQRINFYKKSLEKLFGIPIFTGDKMKRKVKFVFVNRSDCLNIRRTIHRQGGLSRKEYNAFLKGYISLDMSNVLKFETVENACRIFLGSREISEDEFQKIISRHEVENHEYGGHMVVRTMSLPDQVNIDMKQANWFVNGFGTGFGSRGVCQTLGYNNYNMIRGEPSGLSRQICSVSFYYGPGDVNKYPIYRQCYNHVYVPPSVSIWNDLTNKAVNAMRLMDPLMVNCVSSTLGARNLNDFAGISCTRISTQALGYLGFASSNHTDDNDYFSKKFENKMKRLVADIDQKTTKNVKPTAMLQRRTKSEKYVSSFIEKYGVMAPTTCAYMFLGQFKNGVDNDNVEIYSYVAFPSLKKAVQIQDGMAIMWYAGLLEHLTTVPIMVVNGDRIFLSSDVEDENKGRIFAWGLGATAQH